MSDKELEEWLEKRWMGRYLNVLTDNEWDDLNAIQACSDEQAKSIINLFEKSGHRLKMRLLLQELRGTSLDSSDPVLAPSSSPKTSPRSQPKPHEEMKQHDDSDSDAEPPASDDDDDDDDDDDHEDPAPPLPAQPSKISPVSSPVLPPTNKLTKQDSQPTNNNNTNTQAPATPPWVNKTKISSSPTPTTKSMERRESEDMDLPPAPVGFSAQVKPKTSPPVPDFRKMEISKIETPKVETKTITKDSPSYGAEPSLPPPPGALGGTDDHEDEDDSIPPLPEDSDSSDSDDNGAPSGDNTPKTSPKVQPKPSPFASSQPSTITGNGAKNWGAKPVTAGSSSPTISQPSGIKDRMNALNNSSSTTSAASSSSSSSSSSSTNKPQQPAFGGLKDRMNALQSSTSSSSTPSTNTNKPVVGRMGDVQGRMAALAGKIPIQAPGQSHPVFGKARPQQTQVEEEHDYEGDNDPDIGDDYELPPVHMLEDPQLAGWLEKHGNGRHRDEITPMFVILKDDCLYWLRSQQDEYPCGIICLTEPGLHTTMLENDELEITSRKRSYRFRAQDADDLSNWHSKIRVAKMLHTSGAKPKTTATKSTPNLANQVAAKAVGAAFMASSKEEKTYASPKFNATSAAGGRLQPNSMNHHKPPPPDDDEDEDMAPPPAVDDDEDDEDDDSGYNNYSTKGRTPQLNIRAGIASPKQSPKQPIRKVDEEPPEYRRYKEMLKQGQMFQKYKRGKGKKRLIWCPLSLDRILWGDEKKKKVKGYMMVCDIKGVSQGCLGAKKPGNALTITSTERTLDLEAPDKGQQNDWMHAVEMLMDLYRASR